MNLLLPFTTLAASLLGFMRTQPTPIEVEVVSDLPATVPPPHHPDIPDDVAVALVKVRDDLRTGMVNYDWHRIRATTTKEQAGCVTAHVCRELGLRGYWQLRDKGLSPEAEARLTVSWPTRFHPSIKGILNSQNAANRIDHFLATLQ